uniref:Cyclin-dependent protein kinase inhibitor SMR1-like n=1 Tax=Nelumbo nucifera TaxID=4432 RepID=A0A823A4A1_NELNU|nr:TPA_asm: hypothetical protein HUJ06_018695 [Nelumbo nucifera]
MSTDLEFRCNLPAETRLRPIKIQTERSSEEGGAIIQSENQEDECRTPTSEEHKIPIIQTCPPAPRKPRKVVLCKRKLSELRFFEIVSHDEVESFFLAPVISRNVKKRRCASE